MVHNSDAMKRWYRSRIHQKHREANRLSIEVGLGAQDKDDLDVLAETVEALDAAVEMLEKARMQLAV